MSEYLASPVSHIWSFTQESSTSMDLFWEINNKVCKKIFYIIIANLDLLIHIVV